MSEVLKEFRTLQTIRISFRRRGFMFVEPDGYLSFIMVRPAQRRKGLGAAMLRYAKQLYPRLFAIAVGDESERLLAAHHIPAAPPESWATSYDNGRYCSEEEVIDMNPHDLIAQLACELYVKSGRVEGHDLDNWLQAERIVANEPDYAEDYLDDLLTVHLG